METTTEIKIRPLIKADQRRISSMLLKLVDKIDDQSIRDIIGNASAAPTGDGGAELSEDERKANIIRVFMELFKKLMASLHDDAVAFLADLIGVTPEQYEQLPIDIDIRILEQLKDQPEVENFFSGALRLYSATGWFRTTFENLKSKYDTVAASMQKSSKS